MKLNIIVMREVHFHCNDRSKALFRKGH
ncbi:hypothetical protein KP509_19G036800 [Ceratopteris richardii]|uniref:Uncharacterized protein n=1 Tax=Ceratopteris richardii TaxID=49495 RepID=A0A8T2SK89_CERRI|nr:hypothetical protein KP509_19G036800 [Ceratopteris richardii]